MLALDNINRVWLLSNNNHYHMVSDSIDSSAVTCPFLFMQRQRAIVIASMLMLLITLPVLVQAEDSGGVQASTSTLSFSGDAVEGGA